MSGFKVTFPELVEKGKEQVPSFFTSPFEINYSVHRKHK